MKILWINLMIMILTLIVVLSWLSLAGVTSELTLYFASALTGAIFGFFNFSLIEPKSDKK